MNERDFIEMLTAEYAYWREVNDPVILDFAMGAMGAVSNVLAGVAQNLTPQEYRESIDSRDKGKKAEEQHAVDQRRS